jgi:hypothetical protein
MLEKFTQINFIAVLVAGLVSFFLGAIWYMPLFGTLWVRLHGLTDEQVKQRQARMNPGVFFGGMIVSYLFVAFAMAFLLLPLNATRWYDGIIIACVIWLIVAACALTAQLASDRHYGIYAIDVGFYFVFLNFMGVLLVMWP